MNHCDFLRKTLESKLVKSPCRARTRQRKIIKSTLETYFRNEFRNFSDFLDEAHKRIAELSFIGRGTTVKGFAKKMEISKTTARLHLLKIDGIVRDISKKPYIYKIGKS